MTLGSNSRASARRRRFAPLLLSLMLGFASSALAQTLRVLTHDSFAISEEVVEAFTDETGIEVEFLAAGDAGETVNRAILTRGNPLGDLLYGIDNNLLPRALEAGIFEPYESPALSSVDPDYLFDPSHHVTPVDVGFVNFNLDKAFFSGAGLRAPTDIVQLTDPAYRGLTVVTSPTTSSPGLAFMLVTIAKFGESGDYTWLHYWADLRENDLLVTSGWNDAYYTAFSRYGGDRPVVLSYASSPAAEVMFAEETLTEAPTSNLFCEACVYQQIEAAGILSGTEQREAAERFLDYMLSRRFQADIPANMFVYPVVANTPLPDAFDIHAQRPPPDAIASLPSEEIEVNLQSWLRQWSQVVEQRRSPEEVGP